MNTQYIILIDTLGRTVFGQLAGDADNKFEVVSPALINFVPAVDSKGQPVQGQFRTQLLPLIFPQLVKTKDVTWVYSKNTLNTYSYVDPSDALVSMYNNINAPFTPQQPAQQPTSAPRTVKLFDDES